MGRDAEVDMGGNGSPGKMRTTAGKGLGSGKLLEQTDMARFVLGSRPL